MKVCGVEIKGDDAVICVMSFENQLFDLPHVRVPKVALQRGSDSENIRKFQFAFAKLMSDYGVDTVVIKERMTKGKFAGGSQGFKMEAAIQLIEGLTVEMARPADIKEKLKKTQIEIDYRDTGLKQFQQGAFETAFTFFDVK
ncbi:DUF3010 family protein [Thalassotalea sp. PS06]|uniref:DUF3010 family protein n=1 Tax=Thalassotalea sp. PS06 TaxID=2594005 RepID=UPI001163C394|nr:DUF3010 family protein [Thalassotalea sp. PS06]QDP02350.1 DUF3010 family protein [Thalassotalea sp. PS06]